MQVLQVFTVHCCDTAISRSEPKHPDYLTLHAQTYHAASIPKELTLKRNRPPEPDLDHGLPVTTENKHIQANMQTKGDKQSPGQGHHVCASNGGKAGLQASHL